VVTLLCPDNDLEARTILKISRLAGLDLRVSAQGWGARLEAEPASNLADPGSELWIVEIPGPAVEMRLREAGHELRVIDHHWYWREGEGPLDRRHPLSSLEQLAELLGLELDERQRAVALNDRGYLWALLDGGIEYRLAAEIRRGDRELRGAGDSPAAWSPAPAPAAWEFWVGSGPHAALLDGLDWPDEAGWARWLGRGREYAASRPLRILLDQELKNGPVSALTGYGPAPLLDRIWPRLPACEVRWMGGAVHHGYAGGRLKRPLAMAAALAALRAAVDWEGRDDG
jgi:hypothetical protein